MRCANLNCFLFNGVSDEDMKRINFILGNAVLYNKGDELYKSGMLGVLKSGCATVMRHSETVNCIKVRFIHEGEIFGAASIFGEWQENYSSIIADERCEVFYINENDFESVIKESPTIAINYITFLSDRIRFLNRRIDTFTADSTQNRLYEYLFSISDNNGNIDLNFSMSELAKLLNIGRSSLYRDFKSLEDSCLIKRNGQKIKIKIKGDKNENY